MVPYVEDDDVIFLKTIFPSQKYTKMYLRKAKKAAEATLTKSERMNIRISPNDLRRLNIRAMEEGMPYQTLVSSIIHKYLIGRLQEQRE